MAANETHHYPCSSCGADLLFEPQDGFLTCPYCGHKEAIAASQEQVQEQPYEQHLQIRPEQMATLAAGALEVQCQSCGAKSIFTPPEVAGRCDFCGVQIVAQPKSADPILTPGGVLPFAVTQQQATGELRQWLSTRWFAPNGLKYFAQPDAIQGVYLPFWTYDTNTTTQYEGHRGEYYYVTETYTERDSQGREVQRTRQVRHTRWYPTSGTVVDSFDDVLIPATLSLSPDRLTSLEPWDLEALRAYDPAFLSGFKAQRYQVAELPHQSHMLRRPAIDGALAHGHDDELRQIARLRLEEFSSDEIAGRLGYTERTVRRKLVLIRSYWENAGAP